MSQQNTNATKLNEQSLQTIVSDIALLKKQCDTIMQELNKVSETNKKMFETVLTSITENMIVVNEIKGIVGENRINTIVHSTEAKEIPMTANTKPRSRGNATKTTPQQGAPKFPVTAKWLAFEKEIKADTELGKRYLNDVDALGVDKQKETFNTDARRGKEIFTKIIVANTDYADYYNKFISEQPTK